jgi:alginate O-acetyltransferase complex protein AlgI
LFFVAYVATRSWRERMANLREWPGQPALKLASWLLTLGLVCLSWIFFRAARLEDAGLMLAHIFTGFVPRGGVVPSTGLDDTQFTLAWLLILVLLFSELLGQHKPVWERIAAQPRWLRWSAYYGFAVVFLVFLLLNPQHKPQPFVYFQF